jgi:hypothetical protein
VYTEKLPFRQGFKTAVGWVKEDIIPTDRTRETKVDPIGNFGYKTKIASVYKAKITGELFLPVPGGYNVSMLNGATPRGSQIPRIVAQSSGQIIPDVPINTPITKPDTPITKPPVVGPPEMVPEYVIDNFVIWVPPEGHPLREFAPTDVNMKYLRRIKERGRIYDTYDWLFDQKEEQWIYGPDYWETTGGYEFLGIANHTGGIGRPENEPVPMVPKPTQYAYVKPGAKSVVARGGELPAGRMMR